MKYRVMRYPQILQGLMFLTGWKREDICLPKTNKLHWKWVREIPHDKILKAMLGYSMYDQTKGKQILAYQTIPYCEKIIEGIQLADVEEYHVGLGRLFKWLQTALAGRKIDITRRKVAKRRDKEDRQAKIEKEQDRKQRREDYILDTKLEWEKDNAELIETYNKFMERKRRIDAGEQVTEESEVDGDNDGEEAKAPEKPVFDEAGEFAKFDAKEENEIVQIPPAVVDDIDDDWPMNAQQEKEFLDNVLQVN